MLLIWGFKVRFTTIDEGEFACPRCGADRQYRLQEARRWFTLFWIPLFPTKTLGQVVECTTCSQQFDERVLTMPTNAGAAESLATAKRVLVARIVESSDHHDTSRDAAVAMMRRTGHPDYDLEQLDIDRGGTSDGDLDAWLQHLDGALSPVGAENLLTDAVRVAVADGPLNETERSLITHVGGRLGLTPAHIHGIVSQVEATTN